VRRPEGAIPSRVIPSHVVAVKGILIFWKAALFAGRCRNEGLGRSVSRVAVSPAASRRADDSGCPKGAEEGNVVSMRHKAYARSTRTRDRTSAPGRVLHSVLRPVHVNPRYTSTAQVGDGGADELASRLGKPGQLGGTNTGVGSTDVARLAARHSCRKTGAWRVQEKEGDRGLRPCEDPEPVGLVARTSNRSLQKSVGDNGSRISSANALQKEWQGRVNRGLAWREGRRVKPSANVSGERESRVGLYAS
jgi:hypothetical protein